MRLAWLLMVVVAVGCGNRRGSSARPPQAVDAGVAMTGGTGGGAPAGGSPDALGGPTPDAALAPSADADRASPDAGGLPGAADGLPGPADGLGAPADGPGPDVMVDARGSIDLPPPPMTAEFHQTLPLIGAVLTSRTPTFGWTDPGGFEYFVLDVCRDPACNQLIERGFSGLTSYSVQGILDEGKVYWKVRGMHPMGRGSIETPVWYAHVPARSSMRDTSMLAFPDYNGDGYVDLARASEGGQVQVTSFGSLPPAPPVILPGPTRSLASGVDVNADGYADLLVGRDGAVDVYYGGALGLRLVSVLAGGPGFGARVAGLGDVDGDGFGDVMVGSQPDAGAGSAALFRSGRAGLGQSTMTIPLGRFGPAGDVNADGFADVVACSPVTGKASLYVGSQQGLTLAGTLADPRPGGPSWGHACRGVGDLDGDGFGEVVVTGGGAPLAAVVFRGAETGLPAPAITLTVGGAVADDLHVGTAGDVNRDGFTDLVLTSDAVRVYQGGATGVTAAPSTTIPGDWRVAAGLGDISRDLAHDLVLLPRACDQPAVVYPGGINGVVNMPIYTVVTTSQAAVTPCRAPLLAP